MRLRVGLRVELELNDARSVTQVNEDQPTQSTPRGYPAGKQHGLSDPLGSDFATVARSPVVLQSHLLISWASALFAAESA